MAVSSISFLAGMPGGWWVAGTVPADLAQFYWHAIVLCQKLAYLYGWPDLLQDSDAADDETVLRKTLLIGVMTSAAGATEAIAEIAERLAKEVAKRLPRQALTKYGFYNLSKQIGKWIGIQITKSSFSRVVSRIVPVVGGIVAGSVSALVMRPMAKRLQAHLRMLRLAQPDPEPGGSPSA